MVEAAFAKHKALKALDNEPARAADPSPISIAWHVIYTNETVEGGYLAPATINASVSAINDHYAYVPHSFRVVEDTSMLMHLFCRQIGIKFKLDHVDYSQNSSWFVEVIYKQSVVDFEMKQALRRGDAATLNVYTVGFGIRTYLHRSRD